MKDVRMKLENMTYMTIYVLEKEKKMYKGIQFLITNNVSWWRIASPELKDLISYKTLNC